MLATKLSFSQKELVAFCERWKVIEFALFGSAVRDDFSAESDVDVLVTFSAQSEWGLFEHIEMKDELSTLFERNVDLITRRSLEQSHNDLLRDEILENIDVIYAESARG